MASPNLDPLTKICFRLGELALLIGVSTDFLRDQIRSGHLPAMKVSRFVLIKKDAVLKWLDDQPSYRPDEDNEGSSPEEP